MHYNDSRICIRRAGTADLELVTTAFGAEHPNILKAHLCFDNDKLVAISGKTEDGRLAFWLHPEASKMAASLLRAVAI